MSDDAPKPTVRTMQQMRSADDMLAKLDEIVTSETIESGLVLLITPDAKGKLLLLGMDPAQAADLMLACGVSIVDALEKATANDNDEGEPPEAPEAG